MNPFTADEIVKGINSQHIIPILIPAFETQQIAKQRPPSKNCC